MYRFVCWGGGKIVLTAVIRIYLSTEIWKVYLTAKLRMNRLFVVTGISDQKNGEKHFEATRTMRMFSLHQTIDLMIRKSLYEIVKVIGSLVLIILSNKDREQKVVKQN